jgi:hypothetical protein
VRSLSRSQTTGGGHAPGSGRWNLPRRMSGPLIGESAWIGRGRPFQASVSIQIPRSRGGSDATSNAGGVPETYRDGRFFGNTVIAITCITLAAKTCHVFSTGIVSVTGRIGNCYRPEKMFQAIRPTSAAFVLLRCSPIRMHEASPRCLSCHGALDISCDEVIVGE